MDQSLRNTRDLNARIDGLQTELIRRFHKIVDTAAVDKKDRTVTAVAQYQMQAETAAMIRAAEDVQTLIRQMQEMWLFGQLDTIGGSKVKEKTDEDGRVVAELLEELMAKDKVGGANGVGGGD